MDVIYLDFANAFDKVHHKILLSKIRNRGIEGKISIWLYHFLKGRHRVIVANKTMCERSSVASGVPQGSFMEFFF